MSHQPHHRIIIDTDPGIDDAMAIAFALSCPEIEVVALTCVFGNNPVDVSTHNAHCLLEHFGRTDIPVRAGADKPLHRAYGGAVAFVHGNDGLGDAGLAAAARLPLHRQRAAEYIVETVMAHPGEITLVPIGPLTNIALALEIEPKIAHAVKGLVLMGGALRVPGNVTPWAEANFHNDPEAAAQVLHAAWPVTVVGLDATHAITMGQAHLDTLASCGKPLTDVVVRVAPKYMAFHRSYFKMDDGMYLHDIMAVAYLVAPQLFEIERCAATVVCEGEHVGRVQYRDTGENHATFCLGVDCEPMRALVLDRLQAA